MTGFTVYDDYKHPQTQNRLNSRHNQLKNLLFCRARTREGDRAGKDGGRPGPDADGQRRRPRVRQAHPGPLDNGPAARRPGRRSPGEAQRPESRRQAALRGRPDAQGRAEGRRPPAQAGRALGPGRLRVHRAEERRAQEQGQARQLRGHRQGDAEVPGRRVRQDRAGGEFELDSYGKFVRGSVRPNVTQCGKFKLLRLMVLCLEIFVGKKEEWISLKRVN